MQKHESHKNHFLCLIGPMRPIFASKSFKNGKNTTKPKKMDSMHPGEPF